VQLPKNDMKKFILIFNIILFLNSCATKPTSKIESKDSEKPNIGTIDLDKKGLKLKIGPTWYNNESEIHLVYGVTEENTSENFITELHFNFGGNIDCEIKSLLATFDFKNSPELILSDSINKLLPAAKKIIERNQENFSVEFDFKNPNPGILVFSIEKINLKPNSKQNKVDLIIKSQCSEYLNLPIILTKYNVSKLDELVNNYISNELNSLSESELKTIKVIFSYNPIHKTERFSIDMVDQRKMQILSYDSFSKKFVLTDLEKNVIKKIKRT
jgi:hypothetical protein